MNIFLTDKIYFHFDGKNDGGEGWNEGSAGGDVGVTLDGDDRDNN